MSGENNSGSNSNSNNNSIGNLPGSLPNLPVRRTNSFLPMRSVSSYPVESVSSRPADIPAYLEEQGVPLNTPISPDDSGVGPMPMMSIYVQGATPEQMQQVYRRERAGFLYQILSDMGYFHMNPATRPSARNLLTRRFQPQPQSSFSSSLPLPEGSPILSRVPVEEGGDIVMNKSNLGVNAVTQENFENGETVEVLYTEAQARNKREGRNVEVRSSMVFKPESVEALLKTGSSRNPLTRERIALRERRTLRFRNNSTGGKRRNRKSRKSRKSRKNHRKH